MNKLSKEQLKGMNKRELLDYCKSNNIKVYSNKNKAYITNLILQSYKTGKQTKRPVKKVTKQSNLSLELKFNDYRRSLVDHIGPDMDLNYDKIKTEIQYKLHKQIKPKRIPPKIIIHNRNILKKKFGNYVKLYKGISTINIEKGTSKIKLNSVLEGKSKGSVSWTDNRNIAINWASDGYDGYLIEANIPINKILLSYHGSYILHDAGEHEFIVLPFQIKKFNITKIE